MKSILFLLPFFLLHCQVYCVIDLREIKNAKGDLEFRIQKGSSIELANAHRTTVKPLLKLSLNGTTIENIEEKSTGSGVWNFGLTDKSVLEFYVSEKNDNNATTEYYLLWHGGGSNVGREVCVHYGGSNWYDTLQSVHSKWPMDSTKNLNKTYYNSLLDDQFLMVQNEYFHAQELLFLNSDGFAILLDPTQPLFIRRDASNHADPLLCFSVSQSEGPYSKSNQDPSYLDIKIRIFASTNIKSVTDWVVHKSGYLPKPSEIPAEWMFTNPSFHYWGQTKNESEYVKEIEKRGFLSGEIVSGYGFYNDFTIPDHFDRIISEVYSRGFRFKLALQPRVIPAGNLTEYFVQNPKPGVQENVDLSNPAAQIWFEGLLKSLIQNHKVSSFYLENYFPIKNGAHYHNSTYEKYPNMLLTKFVEISSKIGSTAKSTTTQVAFRTQHLPIFTQLWNILVPVDQYLKSLVSSVLQLSIAGYSFITPNPIGHPMGATEEQFIRWTQAVAFMPHMSFYSIPLTHSKTFSAKSISLIKKFSDLHTEHAPTIIELAKKRILDGAPIIRPLWYVAPDDPQTYSIGDQYMLGEDILVAPVLEKGVHERAVYLPSGNWIDQHGKSWTGPGEIKVAAPLEELPYFKRKV